MKNTPNSRLKKSFQNPAECQIFTENEVIAALRSTNLPKADGPDEIHPKFQHPVAVPTLLSFKKNKSWTETKVFQEWRVAKIHPVPKRGKDLNQLANYRPISLTSNIGKVMEKLVTNRFRYITEGRHLLSEDQAGFKDRRSINVPIDKRRLPTPDATLHGGTHRLPTDLKSCMERRPVDNDGPERHPKPHDPVDLSVALKPIHLCYV